jgi:hypothetical protein
MALGVYCECGRCVPVAEDDAGSSLTCPCGRSVVVPLLDEFRDHPVFLSAATVERRVRRLIAEGLLPGTAVCLRCGDERAQVVNVDLACERCTARAHGGQRFLVIPFPLGFLWATWREDERLEIQGRDTDVPTPLALCAACRQQLGPHARSMYLLPAALLLVVGGALGHFSLAIGVSTAAVGLALLVLLRALAVTSWQRSLKGLLGKVPVYRQVLKWYPRAVVVLPDGGGDR